MSENPEGWALSAVLGYGISGYGVFQDQGYKIRKVFAQKSTYPKEIIEFWELD